jgi:hypothetical protein
MARAIIRCWCFGVIAFVSGLAPNGAALARQPIPRSAARQEALELIRDVYRDEIAAAKSAAQKQVLARKLCEQGIATAQAGAEKYVLLKVARDLAAQSGDFRTSADAIDDMAKAFEVDAAALIVKAAGTAAKRTGDVAQNKAIASRLAKLLPKVMAADRLDLAKQMATIAAEAARKSRDTVLAREALEIGREIDKRIGAFADVQIALATLNTNPSDADANLVVGKYRCFSQHDWDRGLTHLALGSDAVLRKVAKQEIEGAADANVQLQLGDNWWKLSDGQVGKMKEAFLARTRYWYARALPKLTGLQKTKAEKRLLDLAPFGLGPLPLFGEATFVEKADRNMGAKVTKLKFDAGRLAGQPQWSADGRFAFFLTTDGVLHKLEVPRFRETWRLPIGKTCSQLGMTSAGLVAHLKNSHELWLIDGESMHVKNKTPAPGVDRILTSPSLSWLYGVSADKRFLAMINAETGKADAQISIAPYAAMRSPSGRRGPGAFDRAILSPDGKFLFCGTSGSIARFGVGRRKLELQDIGPSIASGNAQNINVGASYVAFTAGGGNWSRGYGTYIYDSSNLHMPKLQVTSGAYPRTVGFDPVTGKIYAQNFEVQLLVFSATGEKEREIKLTRRGNEPRAFVPHPQGNKLLVIADGVFWVELPE